VVRFQSAASPQMYYNKSPDTKRKVSVDNLTPIKFGVYSIIKDSVYYMNFSKLSHLKDHREYYKLYDNLKDKEKTERLFMYKNQLTTIMVHWQ
jgi:hypothetical protein